MDQEHDCQGCSQVRHTSLQGLLSLMVHVCVCVCQATKQRGDSIDVGDSLLKVSIPGVMGVNSLSFKAPSHCHNADALTCLQGLQMHTGCSKQQLHMLCNSALLVMRVTCASGHD